MDREVDIIGAIDEGYESHAYHNSFELKEYLGSKQISFLIELEQTL